LPAASKCATLVVRMTEPEKVKRVVIESLIHAFAHSEARTLVGTDALRMVLKGQYRDLTANGGFELDPLDELFAAQPGYQEAPVAAALLRFKSWQDAFRLEVRLPARLAALAASDRDALLEQCVVPAAEVQRVLGGGAGVEAPPGQAEIPGEGAPAPRATKEKKEKAARTGPRRRGRGRD
jgi:hypothetical protein